MVIPRIGASITGYGLAVVNQLDMMGVPVLNEAIPIARSRDKLRALQLLSRFGLDIPRTVMCRYRDEVPQVVEHVGGLPCIIKLLQGTQGVGVMIASTMDEVQGMLDTLWDLGQEILLQELVAESQRARRAGARHRRPGGGGDAPHRPAPASSAPTSTAAARPSAVVLPREYAEAAVKATRVIGLEVAGVDMLESRTGPKIMEVNSSPGFEGLERATKKDIARMYVEHAIELARARRAGPDGLHARV